MNHYEVVQRLEADPSKIGKEQIVIDAYMNGQFEFFKGAALAYDILVTFGVAKIPGIEADDLNPDDPGTFTFNDFIELTDKLRKRELTGHAARDAIAAAASSCHGPSWNDFYRRVLQKDLRCGATDGTVNRALKKLAKSDPNAEKLMVPVFECQLAEDGEDAVHQKKIKGRKFLDIKLDGVRLLTVIDKDARTITQHTRNGKVNEKFKHITKALEPLLDALPGSVVLDGEITAKSFQELMTKVNCEKANANDTKLALFDMIPLEDFRKGKCATTQENRHMVLAEMETSGMLATLTGGSVYVVPKLLVDLDTAEGKKTFNDFNMAALEAGYEGIMIKSPDAPYECRRTVHWLKKKPVISVTLEIVAIEQGKPDGKYKDVLGAFVCRGTDNGKAIESKVGSGFSDEQRVEFFTEAMIGMLVEIEADSLTLESGSDTYSLRFPRFKGFRGAVPGEKI